MTQNDTTSVTPETLTAATIETDVSLKGTLLLGTMETAKGPHALVRKPNGRIERVVPGDKIGRRVVAAIEPGHMVLTRGENTERLSIPGD